MKARAFSLPVFLVITLLFGILGCWNGGGSGKNPIGSVTDKAAELGNNPIGVAKSVQFRIVLPGQAAVGEVPAASLISSVGASALASVSVTFKLIMVNVGNASQPTTTLSKTVSADASGTAAATFFGVPALTCIGDVHIEGGKIGSYTDFHGATDLLANSDNVVVLGPKGEKTREDVIAETALRITANQALFAKATPRLVARIASCLIGFNLEISSIYDDIVTIFSNFGNIPLKIETGSTTLVVSSSVSASGGTVRVASMGSPINGLEVQIPSGAFEQTTNVTISVTTIATLSVSAEFKPITPLISIDNGGKFASEPVGVKIPVTIGTGKIPMAFRFDPITGNLESVPIVAVASGSVVVATRDLSGTHAPAASLRRSILPPLSTAAGLVVFEVAIDLLPDTVDSGFRPGVHSWKNPNCGSILQSEGHCAGSVLSAHWCFTQGVSPTIYGNYDVNETPDIWQDDARAIRLNSMVQGDVDWNSLSRMLEKMLSGIDDRLTFNYFKAGLYLTKAPQYISMWGSAGGHALLVTRLSGNTLFIYDPNFPEIERELLLVDGKFQPFSLSLKKGNPAYVFTEFNHIGVWSMIDGSKMVQRWAEFKAGTIGRDGFPEMRIWAKEASGTFEELADGCRVSSKKLEVALKRNGSYTFAWGLDIFRKSNPISTLPTSVDISSGDQTIYQLPLAAGKNELGLNIGLLPPKVGANWTGAFLENTSWADFQWVTVYAPLTPLASPTNVKVKSDLGLITVSWDTVPDATGYRVYWGKTTGVATFVPNLNQADVIETSHTIASLTNNFTYYFAVTALDPNSTESAVSSEISLSCRFTRDDQGVITDHNPDGNQWFNAPSPTGNTWYSARDWAEGLSVGSGGWKLPTMDQLLPLYPDAWPTGFFPGWSWSADIDNPTDNPATVIDESTAWGFALSRGTKSSAYRTGSYGAGVVAVRSRR
ncbi:MAG: hypothetical protein WA705_24175 [Candidatus Ozemobacteraceae bacterium]